MQYSYKKYSLAELPGGHKELRSLCRENGASGYWVGSGNTEEFVLYLTQQRSSEELAEIVAERKSGSSYYPSALDGATRRDESRAVSEAETLILTAPAPGNNGNGNGNGNGNHQEAQQAFNSLLSAIGHSVASVSEERVNQIVSEKYNQVEALLKAMLEKIPKRQVLEVKSAAGETHKIESRTHKDFPKLVKLVFTKYSAGSETHSRYVMLVGPAGTGKTHIGRQLAESHGLNFYPISLGPDTSQFDLFGFRDAGGNYNPESYPLVRAFIQGGLVLLDEIDSASPESLLSINAMLSNGHVTLPNGEQVKKHSEFYLIAAANTYGRGQDKQYVGRSQLDGATLDRFYAHNFDCDEELEAEFAGKKLAAIASKLRSRAAELKKNIIISSRALFDIAALIQLGESIEEAFEARVFKFDNSARELRAYLKEIK